MPAAVLCPKDASVAWATTQAPMIVVVAPAIRSNNVIVKYNTPFAPSSSHWAFENRYRFRGSQVESNIGGPTMTNKTDLIELAGAVRSSARPIPINPASPTTTSGLSQIKVGNFSLSISRSET